MIKDLRRPPRFRGDLPNAWDPKLPTSSVWPPAITMPRTAHAWVWRHLIREHCRAQSPTQLGPGLLALEFDAFFACGCESVRVRKLTAYEYRLLYDQIDLLAGVVIRTRLRTPCALHGAMRARRREIADMMITVETLEWLRFPPDDPEDDIDGLLRYGWGKTGLRRVGGGDFFK